MENIKIINTFNDISITKENTLILCDIDDTVLTFKHLDKDFMYFYNMIKQDFPDEDIDFIVNEARDFYNTYRSYNKPIHTDYEGFTNMVTKLKNKNSNICFLTARNEEFKDYTKKDLNNIGINYDDFIIYFTGDKMSKGEYIKNNINLENINEIIFIDDYDNYLKSVIDLYPNIICYKFEYKKK
jgi:hypothetical protein